jgi:quinoprotein glucose dehydrogenase
VSVPVAVNAQAIPGALPESAAALSRGEWPAYAGTYAAARYSPLTQIDRENAKKLHVAWRWKSPDHAIKDGNPRVGPTRANESTPVMVGDTLYTSTSLSQVAAIDARTARPNGCSIPRSTRMASASPLTTDGFIAASPTGAMATTSVW